MGDLQVSPAPLPNGEHHPPLSSPPPPPRNSGPSEIKAESWRRAEQATQDIIQRIQPTVVSEQRRRAVVEYVQMLIRGFVGTEVFPYGSVPLKTYLPDGDIDMTALGFPNSEDSLANDVRSVLEIEGQNKDAEFEVKDVQYIHAEVKLVKCLVQNIVVDISFNQIGGLSTLCFLEMVDLEIGKDHLFKRSIILIKAWCYYESRILGAHHGLISTYALETLVLYIFHLFHRSLDGPLAVLYRFLDYYSKFDWDNYCISFYGRVPISSLPELVAEPPETHGSHLLLSKEFLSKCVDMFSVPRGLEHNSRGFAPKHLNIVDPLKESNNLGRSVSKGNFYRIRSAFTYGAGKLRGILELPAECIVDEVNMFFMNTLDRHGSGERPDVQDSVPSCSHSTVNDRSAVGTLSSDFKVENGEKHEVTAGLLSADTHRSLCKKIDKIKVSCSERENGGTVQLGRQLSSQHLEANWLHKCSQIESNGPIEGDIVSDKRLAGDARDLATSRSSDSRSTRESNSKAGASSSGKACHAPHLFFHPENGAQNEIHVNSRNLSSNKVSSIKVSSPDEEMSRFPWLDSVQIESLRRSPSWSRNNATISTFREGSQSSNEENGENGSPKLNDPSDLTGDIDMDRNNLSYAQWCQEFAASALLLPVQQPSLSLYQNKHSWNAFQRQGMLAHMGAGPPFSPGNYLINSPRISGAYGTEDMPRARGIGTYFPNTNFRSYRERQSPRGRNAGPSNQLSRSRNNGRAETPPDVNLSEEGGPEPSSQAQAPGFSGNGRRKPAVLDMSRSPRPVSKGGSHVNGFAYAPNGKLEFGTFGPVSLGISSPERGSRLDSISSHSQGSGPGVTASTVQRPGMSSNRERRAQPYQLKDEGDFPPLTG